MSTLPPGPRGQFGAILGYLRDPLHCMVPMVARYGDPFTLPGKPPIVCTGEPEGIRAIYTADPDTLAPAAADMAVFLGDTSLILVGGAEHRRLRRLAAPPFHAARMRAHGARIIAITEAHTSAWQEGEVASIHALAQKISLDVILRVIFGLEQPAANVGGQIVAGDAVDEFAQHPMGRRRVVLEACARLPVETPFRHDLDAGVPIAPTWWAERCARESTGVGQELLDRDVGLSVLAELGEQVSDDGAR